MQRPTMRKSNILGSGRAVPDRIVTNDDLVKFVDTTDEWIREKTGILERRIASGDETTALLASKAASEALREGGVYPGQVDAIIVGTVTPEMHLPPTACFVQASLGAWNAACFDVRSACTGFVSSMIVADTFLKAGTYRHILVIGADTLTRFVDWTDRKTCVLFGDGAGAVLLGSEEGQYTGALSTYLRCDGRMSHCLNIPGGGSLHPPSEETLAGSMHFLKMEGQEVFRHAVARMSESCSTLLSRAGLTMDDVDLIIPHQANIRILKSLRRVMNIPREKLMINIDQYGNTSVASIPLALHDARARGRLKAGSKTILVSFGGGFTWGGVLIQT